MAKSAIWKAFHHLVENPSLAMARFTVTGCHLNIETLQIQTNKCRNSGYSPLIGLNVRSLLKSI